MNKQDIIGFEDVLNTYNQKTNLTKFNSIKKEIKYLLNKNKFSSYAYLVAKIMGDGHLDKNYQLKFVDKDVLNLINLKKFVLNELNVTENRTSISSREAKGRTYIFNLNYALLGRILYCLGAPRGNKTKQEFLVPLWIMNSQEYSRIFLQGLLEDELTTIKIKKQNHSIEPRLKLAKSPDLIPNLRKFLNQVKLMVENFHIQCGSVSNCKISRKEQKTKELYFHIYSNKENIINFSKNIGFKFHHDKIKELNDCIDVLKKTKYNRKPEVNVNLIIKLSKEGHSLREISRRINLNKSTVHRVVQKHSNL